MDTSKNCTCYDNIWEPDLNCKACNVMPEPEIKLSEAFRFAEFVWSNLEIVNGVYRNKRGETVTMMQLFESFKSFKS